MEVSAAMLILRLGRAQERISQIMEDLDSRSCSKHDPFWEVTECATKDTCYEVANDKLDDIRMHLASIYEQMTDLNNCLWGEDE